MSLENLLKIGQLEAHTTNAEQLGRLLSAAKRSLTDAEETTISNETRLDAAYRAITQLCMAVLWANGYRPRKSRPGHHQVMIQSLVKSIGLDNDEMRLLDTFRVKRHAIGYTGEDVDEESVNACTKAAEQLFQQVVEWLDANKPELLT
jgi:uncharacterized protein (UPF0332 family)